MNSKGKGIITAVIVVLIALAAFCGFGYISQRMTASEGITYLDKKEYQKAYEQFDHAAGKFTLIFTKQKKDVLFYEGEALYQMGEYGKAIEIYDELIDTIRDEKKICHYLDIPIQHASDRILKRMGRRTSKQELIDIVGKLRKEIPDIVLRTTLITGFPGETEEDHEELKEFVDEMEFDRLGVFTYSPEEDTPAAEMADQIPEEVKEERRDELMELQQEISYDRGQDRIGQELLVMIEGKVADESAYIGRTYGDAPKVDGYIFVQTGELLMTGDFAKVRVTGALEYDLIGVLSDEYTE